VTTPPFTDVSQSPTPVGTTTETPSGTQSEPTAGDGDGPGDVVSDAGVEAPVAAAEAVDSDGSLAFTGWAALPLAALGAVVLLAGAVLRRRTS
jgi:hypothetical protein